MANIVLNEGTEIEVKESKEDIRFAISQDVRREKIGDGMADHFITLTCIDKIYGKPDVGINGEFIPPNLEDTKIFDIDIYYKSILFIHD